MTIPRPGFNFSFLFILNLVFGWAGHAGPPLVLYDIFNPIVGQEIGTNPLQITDSDPLIEYFRNFRPASAHRPFTPLTLEVGQNPEFSLRPHVQLEGGLYDLVAEPRVDGEGASVQGQTRIVGDGRSVNVTEFAQLFLSSLAHQFSDVAVFGANSLYAPRARRSDSLRVIELVTDPAGLVTLDVQVVNHTGEETTPLTAMNLAMVFRRRVPPPANPALSPTNSTGLVTLRPAPRSPRISHRPAGANSPGAAFSISQ